MLDRDIHRTFLLQILKDVYSDTSLGPFLGFKGGTAAHLFYGLGRFSVDLDFDLLSADKEGIVYARIENILRDYGTIKQRHQKQNTLFFLLSYQDEAQNIKIEINRRLFDSRYEVKTFLGISMLVMIKEDMFAHKLVAMLERTKTANRDVYDVWHFLRHNWPINRDIVESRVKIGFEAHLKKCIEFVESLSDRHLLYGMGELFDTKGKDWVRENLKRDAVFLLKTRLRQENP